MLVNKDILTWHLTSWQHSCQPFKSHLRKFLLTNMGFSIPRILISDPGPGLATRSHSWMTALTRGWCVSYKTLSSNKVMVPNGRHWNPYHHGVDTYLAVTEHSSEKSFLRNIYFKIYSVCGTLTQLISRQSSPQYLLQNKSNSDPLFQLD